MPSCQTIFARPYALARCLAFLLLSLTAWTYCLAQTAPAFSADAIRVSTNGSAYVVDVEFHVPMPPELVFGVFTDYDHMTDYSPNLRVSKVLPGDGKALRVLQISTVHIAFMSMDFESLREVRLDPPNQIESHGISGDFKSLENRATFAAEGTGTHVRYHAETVPGFMLPGFIGPALIKDQTAKQFAAFIQEIERRQGLLK
jgi:ribosome-associated toxin RatA of RatAB toxin-antitoxin module